MSYYLMHRGWMEKGLFEREPFDRRSAWMWLIEHAAFADTKHHGKLVTRGQVYTSLGRLSKAWRWPRARVQRVLHVFCERYMIECIADTDGRLITICNYDKYQIDWRIGDTGGDTVVSDDRYTTDTRNKEGKKEERILETPNGVSRTTRRKRIEHKYDVEFEQTFWAEYPRKDAKPDAEKAFRTARKVAGLDQIMGGLRRYRAEIADKERQYIKLPAGWLRSQRWLDQPEVMNGQERGNVSESFAPRGPAPEIHIDWRERLSK